jgi:hypothetical protein
VKLAVTKAARGQAIHGRGWDLTAESAAGAKTDIVCEDQQDVRRIVRRGDLFREILDGFLDREPEVASERLFRPRQYFLSRYSKRCKDCQR